ncbi:MAG: tRNA (guanosine(37)-N1)-methyltransferase TrmD [Planctomycetota bacterium]|nr:tRNA (guanosine(37)-N1)-methyltransferase TrmD [Planctomycetota bacterium]
MRIDVLTLFPQVFEPFLAHGQIRIAREKGLLDVQLHDFRGFAADRHRSVDDKPYGGGPGMVIMCGPVYACDEDVVARGRAAGLERPRRLLLSPQGRKLDQAYLEELAKEPWLVLLCGHYEGFDDRIREGLGYEEVSVGDYVLSGGEMPALTVVDGVTRLIPGVLGAPDGAGSDSFAQGSAGGDRLLEGPQYTRPREFRGLTVPEVLLSGDHGAVAAWRRAQARQRTAERRPDLLETTHFTDDDRSSDRSSSAPSAGRRSSTPTAGAATCSSAGGSSRSLS